MYASQLRSPSHHATLGSGGLPTFAAQDLHLPGPIRRFPLHHPSHNFPLLQALPGALSTESSGIGDSKFTGLIKLFDTGKHRAHAAIGISMPTGSTDETDAILTPMGGTPSPRLPYAMQIGSGTVDVLSGFTYVGGHQQFGWGGQCGGDIRTERDNGYRWGHKHQITGWLSYQPQPFITASMRVKYQSLGRIKGIDPRIAAPVQTADLDNYGGDMVNLLFGVNLVRQRGKRIAIEAGFPLLQDLNGPQMETDFILTAGVQVTF